MKITTAEQLDALPVDSLIRALSHPKQGGPGAVFEKIYSNQWLELDPGDRYDGENSTDSVTIMRIYGAGVFLVYQPGLRVWLDKDMIAAFGDGVEYHPEPTPEEWLEKYALRKEQEQQAGATDGD